MKHYLPAFLFLFVVIKLGAQNFNRPVPDRFAEYEFMKYDSSYHGQYFIAPFYPKKISGYDPSLGILDEDGYLLWYHQLSEGALTNFKYHPANHLFSFTFTLTADYGYSIVMDTYFNIVDTVFQINWVSLDNHEFQVLENGNYLLSGRTDSVVDLSAHKLKGAWGSDTTHIRGFVIQELAPHTHELLFQWNSNDHIDPLLSYEKVYNYNRANFDYCHGNTIEKDADGNYMVSFRHLNAVYKVDSLTGNVIWKLGGKDSDFTFTNDLGFSAQHDIRRLSNGNISIFDNANMSSEPQASRPVEYVLDTLNRTATKVWEYLHEPRIYAPAMGNYQRTPEGFHMISYGLSNRPDLSMILLNEQDSTYTYRGLTLELPFAIDRPKVSCTPENGKITLAAPSGYQTYLWSTGDTTPVIMVADTGVYQLWVNKGIGMVGSLPVYICDLNADCCDRLPDNNILPIFSDSLQAHSAVDLRQFGFVKNPLLIVLLLGFLYLSGYLLVRKFRREKVR